MLAVVVGLLTLVGLCFSLLLNDTFDNCTLLPGEVSRIFTSEQDTDNFFSGRVLNLKGGSKGCIDNAFNFRTNDYQQLAVVACSFGSEDSMAQWMISKGYDPEAMKWCPGKFQENEFLILQAGTTDQYKGCGIAYSDLPLGQMPPYLVSIKTETKVCENRFTAVTAAFGFMPMIMRCATFLGAGILIMSRCVKPMNKSGPWYDRFSDLNTSHVVEILELQANNMELQGKVADLNDTQKRMLAKLEMKSVGDEKFVDNKEV